MHQTSYDSMAKFRLKYVTTNCRVLDVGGSDVNGTYKPLFTGCEFKSLDYSNADIIVTDYNWPVPDESFDVVISGQTFEHDKFFWLTLKNMVRVVKKNGLICIIAPSAGEVHRYPLDCYRFYPDAPIAFAEWMDVSLEESYQNPGWYADMVAIFRK